MGTIRNLLQAKGSGTWSIDPRASVYEALEMMAEKDVGALLVIEEGKVVGIFSERDYARRVILKGRSSKETTVRELMTRSVLYISTEKSLYDCMALMTAKHVRHLPVFENDQLVGIVTIGDVVNRIISEQKITISDLENYISGQGYR